MSLLYLGISGIGKKNYFFWPPIVWNTPIVWNKFLFDGPYSKLWWSTVYSTAITNLDFFCTFSGLLTGISKVYLCLKKSNKPKLISYGAKNVIPYLAP